MTSSVDCDGLLNGGKGNGFNWLEQPPGVTMAKLVVMPGSVVLDGPSYRRSGVFNAS